MPDNQEIKFIFYSLQFDFHKLPLSASEVWDHLRSLQADQGIPFLRGTIKDFPEAPALFVKSLNLSFEQLLVLTNKF